jgi:hypothetical protein
MPHITDEEEWELYCLDRLSGIRRDLLDEHLLWCAACQEACEERLERIESIVFSLRQMADKKEIVCDAQRLFPLIQKSIGAGLRRRAEDSGASSRAGLLQR